MQTVLLYLILSFIFSDLVDSYALVAHIFRVASLAQGQYDYPSGIEVTLMDMGENQPLPKHNKTRHSANSV